jgi:hypothetical protein
VLSKKLELNGVDYLLKGGVKNMFNATDTYLYNEKVYNSDTTGRSYWAEIQLSF